MPLRPPAPYLFPYTTLFRSREACSTRVRFTRTDWTHAGRRCRPKTSFTRSEEHTSELQSRGHLVCRLLLEKKKNNNSSSYFISTNNIGNSNARSCVYVR